MPGFGGGGGGGRINHIPLVSASAYDPHQILRPVLNAVCFLLTSIPVTHMSSQSFFCGSQLLSIAA